jgi:sugar-phosphatase
VLSAVIFDFDGLLVDTEAVWRKAEVDVLTSLGVPLTSEMCSETMGLRIDQVVAHWYRRFAWQQPHRQIVAEQIVDRVSAEVVTSATLKPGALEALRAASRPGCAVALASSSAKRILVAALDHFNIAHFFDHVHSAEDEPLGKPDPAVYLSAARTLSVSPDRCLAVEDSLVGLAAAKAAGMLCAVVPTAPAEEGSPFSAADAVFADLDELAIALPDLVEQDRP